MPNGGFNNNIPNGRNIDNLLNNSKYLQDLIGYFEELKKKKISDIEKESLRTIHRTIYDILIKWSKWD